MNNFEPHYPWPPPPATEETRKPQQPNDRRIPIGPTDV